jgi:hypothetical protein
MSAIESLKTFTCGQSRRRMLMECSDGRKFLRKRSRQMMM